MIRIGVRVEKANRHRLDPFVVEGPGGRVHVPFVEGSQNFTGAVDALRDLKAQVSGNQGDRPIRIPVVELGASLSADFQNVTEPPCRYESAMGATAAREWRWC